MWIYEENVQRQNMKMNVKQSAQFCFLKDIEINDILE